MPIPKQKQELYGKVVGHNINTGHSLKEAKSIADKAVKVKKECKICGGKHNKGEQHGR